MKPLQWILIIVVLLPAAPLFAQFDFPTLGGTSAGMGGALVALTDDESALANVAGMARLESVAAALSFRQTFVTGGMGYAWAAVALPTAAGSWGVSAMHYGGPEYNEQCLSLAYALPIGEAFALGTAFHYLHSGTSDAYYDPQNLLTFSLAMQVAPSDELTLGFKAYNPVAVKLNAADELHTPARFNLGVAYWLMEELLAVAEVEKNLYHPASLRFGLEYIFHDLFAARVGLATQPVVYSFGFGMQLEHLGADLAVQMHNVLGMTPQLSIHYRF